MRSLTIIISAIILGAAILVSVNTLRIESNVITGRFIDSGRVVTVKGLAEKEVLADRVYLPLEFSWVDEDLKKAAQILDEHQQKIIAFIKDKGILASDIKADMPRIYEVTYDGKTRYNVTYRLVLDSTKIKEVKALIDNLSSLVKEGIFLQTTTYGINFKYTKLNDIKPQMIEEATANAREVALKFAQDSGSSLGKIKNASQGQFSITNGSTPEVKIVRIVSTVQYYLND